MSLSNVVRVGEGASVDASRWSSSDTGMESPVGRNIGSEAGSIAAAPFGVSAIATDRSALLVAAAESQNGSRGVSVTLPLPRQQQPTLAAKRQAPVASPADAKAIATLLPPGQATSFTMAGTVYHVHHVRSYERIQGSRRLDAVPVTITGLGGNEERYQVSIVLFGQNITTVLEREYPQVVTPEGELAPSVNPQWRAEVQLPVLPGELERIPTTGNLLNIYVTTHDPRGPGALLEYQARSGPPEVPWNVANRIYATFRNPLPRPGDLERERRLSETLTEVSEVLATIRSGNMSVAQRVRFERATELCAKARSNIAGRQFDFGQILADAALREARAAVSP